MKHWTHYLPEANTIKKDGERALQIKIQIELAKINIEKMQKQLDKEEATILCVAQMMWSNDEIDFAKKRCEMNN